MRRLFLNFFVFVTINSTIFPARALAADDTSAEVRAYVAFSLDGSALSDETTIGMQLRESSTDVNFAGQAASSDAPLFDFGLKFVTGDALSETTELLVFGKPVAIADADLGLVWLIPDFADPGALPQPATGLSQQECSLPRC